MVRIDSWFLNKQRSFVARSLVSFTTVKALGILICLTYIYAFISRGVNLSSVRMYNLGKHDKGQPLLEKDLFTKSQKSRKMDNIEGREGLVIFDTTLRDGEQSAGVALNIDEKLEIARELSKFGVDILEAGFPASSNGEFEAVKAISNQIAGWAPERKSKTPPVLCGFARAVISDIDICFEAIKNAPRKRINVVLSTSDIHLNYKLKMSRKQCIEKAVSCITHAKNLCEDIEFTAEDASRSDMNFLCQVFAAIIRAGATTVNIPDTVGLATPDLFYDRVKHVIDHTEGSGKVTWSVHCHNDLGLAVANSLAGIKAGARQVECTINGIGERAGNASLEEIVMIMYTHAKMYAPLNVNQINTKQIIGLSNLVSDLTGMIVQQNKAIVGVNAFTHESGIHQDAILKNSSTYEIIPPNVVGLASNRLLLGKHSGRAGFKNHLIEELGLVNLKEKEIEDAYLRYKNLSSSF